MNRNDIRFDEDMAVRYGIHEAILAAYLWDLIIRDDDSMYRYGKLWTRISQKSLSIHLPFMSESTISRAAKKLKKEGILVIDEFNRSKFDRTYSYAFTEFGEELVADSGCF